MTTTTTTTTTNNNQGDDRDEDHRTERDHPESLVRRLWRTATMREFADLLLSAGVTPRTF